jgi:hypothetical protein
LLARDVLDRQVIDAGGVQIVRPADLYLAAVEDRIELVGIEVGIRGAGLAARAQAPAQPRPGRFLLTGSARLPGLQEVPDLLPGRAETIELSPLSQGEIDRSPDGFVEALFRHA